MVSLGLWGPESGLRGALLPPRGSTHGRGGPGLPGLTAQHAGSAGDQGAISGAKLYGFR